VIGDTLFPSTYPFKRAFSHKAVPCTQCIPFIPSQSTLPASQYLTIVGTFRIQASLAEGQDQRPRSFPSGGCLTRRHLPPSLHIPHPHILLASPSAVTFAVQSSSLHCSSSLTGAPGEKKKVRHATLAPESLKPQFKASSGVICC